MQTKNIVSILFFTAISLSISAASALENKGVEVKENKVEEVAVPRLKLRPEGAVQLRQHLVTPACSHIVHTRVDGWARGKIESRLRQASAAWHLAT